jgi:hypothetical protein
VLRKWAAIWGISVDHFDPHAARNRGLRRAEKRPLEEILVVNSSYCRTNLKQRLYEEGLKDRRCELCGQGEVWRGRTLSLILDHINGVADDNRLENLRILCPNCGATLETHCGRKNLVEVEPKPCALCGAAFHPAYASQRYCSRACGTRAAKRGSHRPRPATRKVERPPYDQLRGEIEEMGYLAVGRKYGVSDNAIRKWVRQYEREAERAELDEAA